MAKLDDTPLWSDVYQLEQTDPVIGGTPNPATGAGMDNIPHLQLAQRTSWLKAAVDTLTATVVAASTSVAGIVKLSTAINSSSTTTAATPSAVKAAYDNAETRALKSTVLTASGLATGGGDLSVGRIINVPAAAQAEAEAGASSTVVMTPVRTKQAITALIGSIATTAGFAASLADGGYVKLPTWLGGWVLQWGEGTILNTDGATGSRVVFPVTFPTACFRVVPSGNSANGLIGNCSVVIQKSRDKSGFYAVAERDNTYQSSSLHYIAIGK